jgi:K(+)-stimulated pyrophosphate-energized sodium pump
MAELEPAARKTLADLDAVGNTTKAITKAITIGSAVIAAVSLFGTFITDVNNIAPGTLDSGVRVSNPVVFAGLMIRGTLPWLFSCFY